MYPTCQNSLFPPRFSAAIFDFDGTLAATTQLWQKIDREFFEVRNIPYDHNLSKKLSPLGFAEGAHWAVEAYNLDESPEHVIAEWTAKGKAAYQHDVVLRPGAEKYIRLLRSLGIKTALATVNDADVFASMEPRIPFFELFDVMVFGSDVGKGKDKPDLYQDVLIRLNAPACSTIIFEDLPVALKTAKALSLTTCAVQSDDPAQNKKLLTAYADFFIESWEDPELLPKDA